MNINILAMKRQKKLNTLYIYFLLQFHYKSIITWWQNLSRHFIKKYFPIFWDIVHIKIAF